MPAEIVQTLPEQTLLRPMRWPAGCGAVMTTRAGGVSRPPFASLNLKAPPGDDDEALAVAENRRRFAATLAATPVWLDQVHGVRVVRRGEARPAAPPQADASFTLSPGIACTVLVADCLPVLLASRDGRAVGAAHAGWRGLAAGVLEATVQALCEAARVQPGDIVAWLGACIGPQRFEVGDDVREAFEADETAFFQAAQEATARDGRRKWLADLPGLARARLRRAGLQEISGCGLCTASDGERFFSFRRDGRTGRLAAAAWIDAI